MESPISLETLVGTCSLDPDSIVFVRTGLHTARKQAHDLRINDYLVVEKSPTVSILHSDLQRYLLQFEGFTAAPVIKLVDSSGTVTLHPSYDALPNTTTSIVPAQNVPFTPSDTLADIHYVLRTTAHAALAAYCSFDFVSRVIPDASKEEKGFVFLQLVYALASRLFLQAPYEETACQTTTDSFTAHGVISADRITPLLDRCYTRFLAEHHEGNVDRALQVPSSSTENLIVSVNKSARGLPQVYHDWTAYSLLLSLASHASSQQTLSPNPKFEDDPIHCLEQDITLQETTLRTQYGLDVCRLRHFFFRMYQHHVSGTIGFDSETKYKLLKNPAFLEKAQAEFEQQGYHFFTRHDTEALLRPFNLHWFTKTNEGYNFAPTSVQMIT